MRIEVPWLPPVRTKAFAKGDRLRIHARLERSA
jgi:hypothetical protein